MVKKNTNSFNLPFNFSSLVLLQAGLFFYFVITKWFHLVAFQIAMNNCIALGLIHDVSFF